MTTEQQEMLCAALVARDSGFVRVEIVPQDLIDALNRIVELEARVEEMRRKYEPTMAERGDDMDAMAGMNWG